MADGPTPPPLVRDARQADVEPIRSVAEITWWATYTGLRSPGWIREHLAEYYSPELLAENIEQAGHGGDCHFLVAECDGEVVGYLHFLTMPDRGGPYLRRLYVLPDLHGKGIGRALAAELHSRLRPGSAYRLDVHPENERAVRFYRGLGADWTGERIEPCWDLMEVTVPG